MALIGLVFAYKCVVFIVDASRQDVHAPAANLTELKKTEALREKMAAIREKRRVNALLGCVLLIIMLTASTVCNWFGFCLFNGLLHPFQHEM